MKVLEFNSKLNMGKRAVAVLAIALMIAPVFAPYGVQAAVPARKKLTLDACRALAVQNSTEYDSAEISVESKQAAYESAVKSLALKEKSMKQFRWSPLLSFKFPTEPNLAEASEFQYKPTALSYEIRVAQHKVQDKIFAINEKVNNLYLEIVVLQDTIAFNEKRLESTKEGLAQNQARLRLGQANKADVEKLEKKVESLNNKVASDRRTLEADLKKMSKMVGFDVSTMYIFEKPYLEATIERSMLDALIEYTEDRDETYYEACVAETTARIELTTNAKLMKKHYGGDYNMIESYVSAALAGGDVNKKAFSKQYKAFLTKIDSYWNGKKRICLFIKLPKLWFKGDMDGTRYIEDDPTVLQSNVLDYAQAVNDKKGAQEDLDQSVIDTFNSYISVRNSYKQYLTDVEVAEENLKKDALRNRKGELSFEEYDSAMESYEELQNNMLDSMKLYTNTLFAFDRLTCGGISALLSGTDADMHTAVVGESYIEENTAEAYYTLRPIVQKQEFELTLQIPEDFDISISDYELWVNNQMVGTRTEADKKLRHLMLTFDAVEEAKIRLYDGDDFVDDCVIDPSVESGPLKIRTGFDIKRDLPGQIGTYEMSQNEATGMLELKFTMNSEGVEAASFKVKTQDGKTLGKDETIPIDKSLIYIELLRTSVDDLKIEFYDEAGELWETARFDSANSAVIREDE